MKLLLLPAYFTPESEAGSHLADNRNEAFADAGFDMEVHTPAPSRGISSETRQQYRKKRKEKLYDGKMTVYRFPMFREGVNPIIRALRYTLCCIIQFFRGCLAKDIDVIFVASTPPIQGAMAAMVKKVKKAPLIFNLQDIFPDSLVGTGLANKGSFFWKVGRIIEDFTYRNADKIIVISEDFKKNIIAKGVLESKIEVIYNWVDENAVSPVLREKNSLFEEYGLNRKDFYVVYAGNIGHAQNIEIIIESAYKLKNHESIKFVIFGSGGLESHFKKKVSELMPGNIYFFPLQPINRISEVYSLGNVAIVSCRPGLGMSVMPSKTWSIMSSGTPILASFDEGTDLQRILEKNKVGLFSSAGDIDKFTAAILKLFHNPQLCEEYGKNGRDYILKNLTRDVGTSKYVKVIRQFENAKP